MKISHFQVINEMLIDGEPALSPIPEDSVIDLVSKFYVLRTNIYVLRFMTNCITLICLTNQHFMCYEPTYMSYEPTYMSYVSGYG